jgi:sporulation protein YlmC with PRC-barrel domain
MRNFHIDNITGFNASDPRQNDPLKCLSASSIIGDRIFNPAGEALGRISDIMIDIIDGKVEYFVVQFGGLLGFNQKYFAIPMQALAPAKEHSRAFILNETKESLNLYPGFDKNHWPQTNAKVENSEDS